MMGHTMAGHPSCLSRKYSAEGQGIFIYVAVTLTVVGQRDTKVCEGAFLQGSVRHTT